MQFGHFAKQVNGGAGRNAGPASGQGLPVHAEAWQAAKARIAEAKARVPELRKLAEQKLQEARNRLDLERLDRAQKQRISLDLGRLDFRLLRPEIEPSVSQRFPNDNSALLNPRKRSRGALR